VVDQIANRAPALISQAIQRWRVAKEVANDIVKLALYDIVLYIGKYCCHPEELFIDFRR
jgi:hypothetical protein